MQKRVRNRFAELLARKERLENRRYTLKELSEAIGISETSIKNWKYNYATRFDESQILALTSWFRCEISDLLVIEIPEDEDIPETNTPLAVPA